MGPAAALLGREFLLALPEAWRDKFRSYEDLDADLQIEWIERIDLDVIQDLGEELFGWFTDLLPALSELMSQMTAQIQADNTGV